MGSMRTTRNARTSIPSFGISTRSKKQVGPVDDGNIIENTIRIPIIDLNNYLSSEEQVGEVVLNILDGLLYYHNSLRWVPLEVKQHLVTSESTDLSLSAKDNPPSVGGNVEISAGKGGIDDGEIYFNIGGERAVTINKNGDLVVENSTKCKIDRAEITTLEDGTLPDVTLNGATSILTINLALEDGESLSGVIHNESIYVDSWVSLSVVGTENGSPYAWLDKPQDGSIQYHVLALVGEFSQLQLHLLVRNE